MKKLIGTLGLVLLFAAGNAWAAEEDHEFLQYHHVSGRFGMGTTFGPGAFSIATSAEYNFDKFFSVGPIFQIAVNSDTTIFVPTGGGRFTAPLFFSKRVEFSIQSGIGMFYRVENGISFRNFAFETGANIDVYVIKHLTAGLGFIWNVTNSTVQRSLGNLFASASYRF